MELKNPGENIHSNLHVVMMIFFSINNKSSILKIIEHKSLKNLLNSAIGFHA